jgi:hypothetical protein
MDRETARAIIAPYVANAAHQSGYNLNESYKYGVLDARNGRVRALKDGVIIGSRLNIGYLMGVIDEMELDIDYRKAANVKAR